MLCAILLLISVTPAFAKTVAAGSKDDNGSAVIGLFLVAACAAICGLVAKAKGRNPVGWVIAGVVLNVFAVIAVLIVRKGEATTKRQTPEQQRETGQRLFAIQNGTLKPFVPNGVMPQDGEQFYWEQRALYGQTQSQRMSRGSNPALYIPLGHGFKMRLGGYQGSSKQISNFAWGPKGTVYVSNRRILFKADDGEVAQAPFHEVITYDAFADGLGLNVSKIGIMQFKTGDECLGGAPMTEEPPTDAP